MYESQTTKEAEEAIDQLLYTFSVASILHYLSRYYFECADSCDPPSSHILVFQALALRNCAYLLEAVDRIDPIETTSTPSNQRT